MKMPIKSLNYGFLISFNLHLIAVFMSSYADIVCSSIYLVDLLLASDQPFFWWIILQLGHFFMQNQRKLLTFSYCFALSTFLHRTGEIMRHNVDDSSNNEKISGIESNKQRNKNDVKRESCKKSSRVSCRIMQMWCKHF